MGWPREKLVRWHVPDQLRARGETIETRIAEPGELPGLLVAKLREEVDELIEALAAAAVTRKDGQVIEELADVQEVLEALKEYGGWGLDAAVRQIQKREEKGRFTNIVMRLDDPVPMVLLCSSTCVPSASRSRTRSVPRNVDATARLRAARSAAASAHQIR